MRAHHKWGLGLVLVLFFFWLLVRHNQPPQQRLVAANQAMAPTPPISEQQQGGSQAPRFAGRSSEGQTGGAAEVHRSDHLGLAEYRDCEKIFIDIGSNTGDSIEKFLEASWYVESQLAAHFEQWKQQVAWSGGRECCIFGFEANPHFTALLQRLPARFPNVRIKIFTETAIGHLQQPGEPARTAFFLDAGNAQQSFWASSLLPGNLPADSPETFVDVVDLGWFLQQLTQDHSTTISIKMDIEGGEYLVLPPLIIGGWICLADVMFIEWHRPHERDAMEVLQIPRRLRPSGICRDSLRESLTWLMSSPHCGLQVVELSSLD